MNTPSLTRWFGAVFLCLFCIGRSSPLLAADIAWTNTAGGSWTDAANWMPNQVPSDSDTARITNNGTYIVTLDANVIVADLVLGGSTGGQSLSMSNVTLSVAGNAVINTHGILNFNGGVIQSICDISGLLNWTGGQISGPLTVTTNGALNISGAAAKALFNSLTNHGTVTWSGTGDLGVNYADGFPDYAGFIYNASDGLFDVQNDQYIGNNYGGGVFENAGLFRKSGGSGTTSVGVRFDNTVAVDVQIGLVALSGGGNLSGHYTTASATTINLAGGNFTAVGQQPVFSGSGQSQLTGGMLTLTSDAIENLLLAGGFVVVSDTFQGGSVTNLTLSGATLMSTNTVTGILNWTGGRISGPLTVAANGALNISGVAGKELFNSLTNHGIVTWSGTGDLGVNYADGFPDYAGFIYNANDGLFDVQNDQYISDLYGGGVFENAGLFRKSGGNGTTSVGVRLDNTVAVDVQIGVVALSGGGNLSGHYTTASATTINLAGGNFTAVGQQPVFSGSGQSQLTGGMLTLTSNAIENLVLSGGSLVVSDTFQGGSITNLTLSGATLVSTNTVTGTLNWTGGAISGPLTVATNGALNISGAAPKQLWNSLTNHGNVTWSGTGDLSVDNSDGSAVLAGFIHNTSDGLFDVQNDQYISDLYGGGVFENAGLFRKSGGSGTTSVGVQFDNAGTVQSQTGTIAFAGIYVQTAGLTFLQGGDVSASALQIEGGLLAGSGTITGSVTNNGLISIGQPIGLLKVNGDYLQTTNGSLVVEIGGFDPGTNSDLLRVNGSVYLAGNLVATPANGFYAPAGVDFPFLTSNLRTGSFDHFIYPTNSVLFSVDYNSTSAWIVSAGAPPALAAIADQMIPELSQYSMLVSASDPDQPYQSLVYSLTNAPPGMTIDPISGLLQWLPSETQGPSTNTMTVVVTDNGNPVSSDSKSFQVVVSEVNTPPVLGTVPNRTVILGDSLNQMIPATDADWPSNSVSFQLLSGPGGATLNPATGLFSWTPEVSQSPSSNSITFRVYDDGLPSLSVTGHFLVTVRLTNSPPPGYPNFPDQPVSWTVVGNGTETWQENTLAYTTNQVLVIVPYGYSPLFSVSSTQTFTATITGTATYSYLMNVGYPGMPFFYGANARVQMRDFTVPPGTLLLEGSVSSFNSYYPLFEPDNFERKAGTFNIVAGRTYRLISSVAVSGFGGGERAEMRVIRPDHLEAVARTGARVGADSGTFYVNASDGEKNIGGFHANALPVNGGIVSGVTYSLQTSTPNVVGFFSDTRTTTTTNPSATIIVRTIAPPAITTQPVGGTFLPGSSGGLSVTATGAPPLHYQWYLQSDPVSGGVSNQLLIPSFQSSDAGGYFVIVSNAVGAVASTVATVHVLDIPSTVTMRLLSAGQLELSLTGTVGVDYVLEVSTNLTQWNSLQQVHLSTSPLSLTVTNTNLTYARFYRLKAILP